MGNRPFAEKRDGRGDSELGDKSICYRNSSLHVQRELKKYAQWSESTIQERGDEIIDFAMERWQINPTAGPEAKAAQTSG